MDTKPIPGRIRMKCRRGMLELDFALERFLERGYGKLSEQQQNVFEQLLAQEDPVLYQWILGYDKPKTEEQLALITLIQMESPKL